MQTANNNIVLRKDDYQLLVSLLNGAGKKLTFDRRNAQDLLAELKKATLVPAGKKTFTILDVVNDE